MLESKFLSSNVTQLERVLLGAGWLGSRKNCDAIVAAGASGAGASDGVARGLRFRSRGADARIELCGRRFAGCGYRHWLESGAAIARAAVSGFDQPLYRRSRSPDRICCDALRAGCNRSTLIRTVP